MTIVRTDDLKEHMVLSGDVREIDGRLLLREGQAISSQHIQILKKWGVTEVPIAIEPKVEETRLPDRQNESDEKIEQEIKPLFRYTDMDHPAVKELFRVSAAFRAEQGIGGGKNTLFPEETSENNDIPAKDLEQQILRNELKLPEIPNIIFELNEILAGPNSTADNLAQVVSKSPSLTSVLLRVVNSPFYGFASKIDTIPRAVTIIGTKEITSLALSICAMTVFKGVPPDVLDMNSFLRHSFTCGLISRALAAGKNIPQTEQLFVAGLLHDMGRVIIYTYFPDQAKALLSHCLGSHEILYREEKKRLRCDHTDIARYLLQTWKFPEILEDNISHHHNPMEGRYPMLASILHLADIIVNALGIGTSGEHLVPPLNADAWELLALQTSIFEMVIRQAVHQLSALEPLLLQKEDSDN